MYFVVNFISCSSETEHCSQCSCRCVMFEPVQYDSKLSKFFSVRFYRQCTGMHRVSHVESKILQRGMMNFGGASPYGKDGLGQQTWMDDTPGALGFDNDI